MWRESRQSPIDLSEPQAPGRGSNRTVVPVSGPGDGRFLSEAACQALAKRVIGMAIGGGHTQVALDSVWTGAVHWARNRINVSDDVRNNDVGIIREIRGAHTAGVIHQNMIDDASLEAAMRRAERLLQLLPEIAGSVLSDVEYTEQHLNPMIWSEATYRQEAGVRAEVARSSIQIAEQAGLVAAGSITISASGRAVMNSRGRAMYYPYTGVQCSMTVRDPQGTGSGWAGVSHWDWGQIDPKAITQRAVEKCLASRNPVALEPGRYTTILEPQAVYQLVGVFWDGNTDPRLDAERGNPVPPFGKGGAMSRLGEVVMDERLTVESDPMDPELGQVPFAYNGNLGRLEIYRPVQWVRRGVLVNLGYDLSYAMNYLGKNTSLLTSGVFRMRSSAPPVSVDEMIATTTRGLLVTRLDGLGGMLGAVGYTRDGLWLVENGKIAKPVKNFQYRENPYSLLQPARLEQIGAPVRVFTQGEAVVVPALKVKDFNFTQLVDAV